MTATFYFLIATISFLKLLARFQGGQTKNVKLDATAVNLLIRYALNGKYTGRNNA